MKEKDFQGLFTRYVRARWARGSAAFELKICKGTSLPFAAVQPHQLEALREAKNGRIAYKIPDDSAGFKPFDCFVLSGSLAFVVVQFYARGCKRFYLVDIDAWDLEVSTSKRKSLTEARAAAIGETVSY